MNMQSSYRYDQLATDEIRLLRLRPGDSNVLEGELVTCRLLSEEPDDAASPSIAFQTNIDVRLVASGEFDALTYCWSSGDPGTHITIYDQRDPEFVRGHIPLKPNLEAALKTFRASLKLTDELQYFWIDALCIDQSNKFEKSAQIQKIPAIYNQANVVRIWLGKSTPKSDIAMDFIGDLVQLDDIDKLSKHVPFDHKWAAFRDLMRREWFHRRWIIQEIALARTPVVYCGAKTVPWETFTYAVSLFASKASQLKWLFKQSKEYAFDPDYLGEVNALGAKILVDLTNNLFRKHDNGEIVEHLLSLEALMSTLNMFQASSPHDTVYSILWLAHDATPRATRKPAALFPEVSDTPHPSPHLRPTILPPVIQTDQVPSMNGSGFQSVSDSPEAVHQDHVTSLGSMTAPTFSHKAFPPDTASPTPQYLKPPDLERRRRRSNSWALLRAEKDIRPEPKPIEVDYDKDIFEVYREFLEFVITRSRSLDVICRPWAPPPAKDRLDEILPSWIPQLSGSPYALVPHTMVYQRVRADPLVGIPGTGIRPYNACGKQRAYNTDSAKPFIVNRSLVARGFVLDELGKILDKAAHGSIPSSWLDLVDWQDHSRPLPSRFWQTLVADKDLDGISLPPAHFPLACKWAFSRRTQNYDLNTDRLLHHGICPELCFNFLRRLQAVVWDRRLTETMGTKHLDGSEKTPPLLSLVPPNAEKGDLICILYGCSVPVILRKKEFATPPRQPLKRRAEPPKQQRKGTLKLKRPRLDLNPTSDPGTGILLGQGLQFGAMNTSPPARAEDVDSSPWSGAPYANGSLVSPAHADDGITGDDVQNDEWAITDNRSFSEQCAGHTCWRTV